MSMDLEQIVYALSFETGSSLFSRQLKVEEEH